MFKKIMLICSYCGGLLTPVWIDN